MNYQTVLIGAFLIVLCIFIGLRLYKAQFSENEDRSGVEDYFISTSSQSQDRVKSLSLDASSLAIDSLNILDIDRLNIPSKLTDKPSRDEYLPDDNLTWTIDIDRLDKGLFLKDTLEQIFDRSWTDNYRSTVYGRSNATELWSYAFSADATYDYNRLRVAVPLMDRYGDQKDLNREGFKGYEIELSKRLRKEFQNNFKIIVDESYESVVKRRKNLATITQELANREVLVWLKFNKPQDGLRVWETLQMVGLRWGDGDLFHWKNPLMWFGDDSFFSVWTTSPPGYFLPEEIREGTLQLHDLVFGFSVPRSADPVGVYDVMMECITVCRNQLGGSILDSDGKALKSHDQRKSIEATINVMKDYELKPGEGTSMRLF